MDKEKYKELMTALADYTISRLKSDETKAPVGGKESVWRK